LTGSSNLQRSIFESPRKKLPLFLEQLTTLLGAGLTINIALRSISRDKSFGNLSILAVSACRRLNKGELLSDILQDADTIFNKFDIAVIRTSEESGDLGIGFSQLLEHHKKRQTLNEKLKSTFTYPAILTVAAFSAVIILMTIVIPKFEPIIQQQNITPPWITSIMLSLSHFLIEYGWVTLLIVFAFGLYCKTKKGSALFHHWVIRAPWLGNIIESLETERWTRGVALLVARGISLPKALELGADLYSNTEMRQAGYNISQQIKEGRKLTTMMAETGHFPDAAIQLLRTGEETGDLGKMLNKSADYLAVEVYSRLNAAISVLEPLIILILGGIIALIVISLMMTTMSLNSMVL
jgi:general secretion pathway protein F